MTRGGWNTDGSMLLFPDKTGTGVAFDIAPSGLDSSNNKSAFRVLGNGKVKAGYNSSNPFMATDDDDVATKAYVESQVQAASVTAVPATMDFVYRSSQSQNLSAGQFARGPSGSKQVNVDYRTWSGVTWCTEENFTNDQACNELFSVYKKNNDGSWELRLVIQVMKVTWGYRPDSYTRRRMELKDTYIKMGSYSNLVDYGTYYCKFGGIF